MLVLNVSADHKKAKFVLGDIFQLFVATNSPFLNEALSNFPILPVRTEADLHHKRQAKMKMNKNDGLQKHTMQTFIYSVDWAATTSCSTVRLSEQTR